MRFLRRGWALLVYDCYFFFVLDIGFLMAKKPIEPAERNPMIRKVLSKSVLHSRRKYASRHNNTAVIMASTPRIISAI